MDAGARGRRLLQRREYRAKVSEFIPKELEDHVVYENPDTNMFPAGTQEKVKKVLDRGTKFMKQNPVGRVLGRVFGSSKPGSNYTPGGKVVADSYVPEANSAQMKAMHDAQMKKKEDDKVAAKKKNVKEGSAYGITRGSGKPSGAFKDYLDKKKKEKKKVDEACWKGYEKKGMKTMFGKRYPNCVKKTKKEEVQLEAKVDKGMIFGKSAARNERRFGKKGHFDPSGSGSRGQGTSERAKLAVKRGEEHKARRGVKTKGVKEEVQLEAKKSCGDGEYYCYDDQKCKSIPEGMKVGKDGMLVKEDMKGMSQKSGDKRSTESGAGMTAQGVAKYNRRTGGNLKTAVTTPPSKLKPGSKAAKRRKSFCARSKSWTGPRGKAARRRWNCSYEPELPMIIDEKKKLFNSAPLSDRVAAWSKKITEGDVYVKSNRNRLTGLPNLGKGDKKKTTDTKITGVDYKTMLQSYEPQGEMIEAKKYKGKINRDVLKKNPKLNPNKPGDYIRLKRMTAKADKINERKMTSSEKDKKEKYVKGMKKVKGDFTKRYGKDGKSVMYATATKMAMKEVLGGVPGDGYLGHPNLDIKNPFAKKQIKKPVMPNAKPGSGGIINRTAGQMGDYNMQIQKLLNQSYEPVTEAKYEKGASTYGKASIRNKRMFGKGGNAAPPEERGAAIKVRRARHQERRYVKKGNKYHEPGKHRPEVYGVNKPEEERKGKNIKEGSLHKWFKGSKSKDGKPGWVNVVTGGTCASDKPGEGTPKCVSSSKRASMSKAERLSASRRKKKADPGQQSKSGAAKPTYVATDSKKKK